MVSKIKELKKNLKKPRHGDFAHRVKGNAFAFQDELRYGTRTHLKRRWTPQKVRPEGKVKLGYEWGYLYVAINPVEGKLYAYFLPTMRKASFQAFLDELAQEIEQPVSLFVDGAASHRSDLQLPDCIDLQLLPAYCPELNPVERFFAVPAGKELRRVLANRIYDSLEEVEQVIEHKLQQYWRQPAQLVQLTNWHWFYPDNNI